MHKHGCLIPIPIFFLCLVSIAIFSACADIQEAAKRVSDDISAGISAPSLTIGGGGADNNSSGNLQTSTLPMLENNTAFGRTDVVGIRIGMLQGSAVQAVNTHSPGLLMWTSWMSTRTINQVVLRGAIGMPQPEKPDVNWIRDEPHLKLGLEFTPPRYGGDCLPAIRPGTPGITAGQRNRICERIWLQTTPEWSDDARVVAVSRTLIFGW